MARRRERQYAAPLVKPRSTWSEDELKAETLALVRMGVEPKPSPEPATAEPEPLAQLVTEAVAEALAAKKRIRKRDLIPEPSGYRIIFNAEGEGIAIEGPDGTTTPLHTARKTNK